MQYGIIAGRIQVATDDVTTVVEHDDVVIFNVECVSKRPQVAGCDSQDGYTVVWLEPGDNSLYLDDTTNECTEFVIHHGGGWLDWSVIAQAGKWAVTVVVWRRQ